MEDDFEDELADGRAIVVYDDCSCDGNYICRKCLAKW